MGIKEFYDGCDIFITGGTGFMGKVLIEKLLRSCPGIRNVYVLMRNRKDKCVTDRIKDMLALPLFDKIKTEHPGVAENKIIPVLGDLSEIRLGMSDDNYNMLVRNISIIFHVAATVRFDEPIRDAIIKNVRGTREVVRLAAQMKNLMVFLHVSTTYCNCNRMYVEEKVYESPINWQDAILIAENLDPKLSETLSTKLLGLFPNTYTFTKLLAEQIISEKSARSNDNNNNNMPMVIFRPSIVISSIAEPVLGWIDNVNGPVGLMLASGKGVTHVTLANKNSTPDLMAVDVSIKAMIVAAYHRGIHNSSSDIPLTVYNSSSVKKSITNGQIMQFAVKYFMLHPFDEILWRPRILITGSKWIFYNLTIIQQVLPAILIDFILKTTGQPPKTLHSFGPYVSRKDFKTTAMTNLNGVLTPPSTPSPNLLQMNMAREREKYLEEYNFPFCEAATKFEKLAKIGQGTFGEVFKAREKKNPKFTVAMKKILMENEKEGFPITALREIRILQLLKHDNVVNLLEICQTRATQFNRYRSTFYLVFEFCEHDLAGLLSNTKVKFSLGEIKQVIQQMLNGLYYIHSNKILHRDMKAANVLITKSGTLKLADFGLARAFSAQKNGQPNRYTNRVVTLWYRPPELLLGDRNYGPPVDLWGAGCIMAEMWTRSPIMQGNSEQQQLTLISQLCGSIMPEVWPKVESLDLYNQLELVKGQKRKVKERLKPYVRDPMGCDLLDKLLVLDPAKRFDADSALNHDFFWTDPMPCDLSKMLSQQTQSNFEYLAPRRLNNHQSSAMRPASTVPSQGTSTSATSGFHERVF